MVELTPKVPNSNDRAAFPIREKEMSIQLEPCNSSSQRTKNGLDESLMFVDSSMTPNL